MKEHNYSQQKQLQKFNFIIVGIHSKLFLVEYSLFCLILMKEKISKTSSNLSDIFEYPFETYWTHRFLKVILETNLVWTKL
jgi:hypothetical protein